MLQLVQLFGWIFFWRDHPFWNAGFHQDFGARGVGTVAVSQLAVFAFAAAHEWDFWIWPGLVLLGFIVGTPIGLFLCWEAKIIGLAYRRRIRLDGGWMASQCLGIVLIFSAFVITAYQGRPSVADGIGIYLL